ncbi:GntR family transcriptional regulator [Chachezhania antarctica]|uniref:GntR family transcriptional regulator n=1 Tax=Chachezhania antarctica TaxID=2340860 RepID=UPI000EB39969|nr:GntR family transcriptional regulator [Chachezhania antarctica]|tara:strand:+ start:4155 stop:4850 length:696 start_codon:yes stop_codon:yes gene_type:complete
MKTKSKLSIAAYEETRPLQGETAYDRLRDEIRSGRLRPGARLTETEIAERLSVSRTPVREAIRRLESEGLVDHQARAGAVVRKLDYSEIMELYEMRAVLESTAARLAARAASEVEIRDLRDINAQMGVSEGDPQALARLNRQFHQSLLHASRNRFLLKSMGSVDTTMMILGPTSLESPDRAREAVAEHDEIIAALAARDEATAEAAMRRHMEGAQSERLRMLRRDDDGEQA